MAIEDLFYALLPHYKDELPDDFVRQWQPRQIIDALIDCNPLVELEQHIKIGPAGNSNGEPFFVGYQKPVSRKLLRQYYHRLGSYLHATRDASETSEAKLRATVEGALARVDQHCRETTVIHNGGIFIEVNCECGRKIKRNLFALAARQYIICPDPDCGAIYDLIHMEQGTTLWKLREDEFTCPACKEKTRIGVHRLRDGANLTCSGCQAVYVIRVGLIAQKQVAEPVPAP